MILLISLFGLFLQSVSKGLVKLRKMYITIPFILCISVALSGAYSGKTARYKAKMIGNSDDMHCSVRIRTIFYEVCCRAGIITKPWLENFKIVHFSLF